MSGIARTNKKTVRSKTAKGETGSEQTILFDRVVSILERARSNVIRSVNTQMVEAYWSIGREIVQIMQSGEKRAGYGHRLIDDLSVLLVDMYGKGFSAVNLKLFRQFYLSFPDRNAPIGYTVCSQLEERVPKNGLKKRIKKVTQCVANSELSFYPNLGWSHYRLLMRIDGAEARDFYEKQASENHWSVRQLGRQMNSMFYERLVASKDKNSILLDNKSEPEFLRPIDIIKDPYILEFLDIPETAGMSESDLEGALISSLQDFLMELGAGFSFVGRQKRLTLEGDHFYPDLIFYHIGLKCYVIIDLKTGKLNHGDIGQMQMYVNFYDREIRSDADNPTVGLLLCAQKNDSVVRYVLSEDNQQIFASKYKLALPSESKLKQELDRKRQLIAGTVESPFKKPPARSSKGAKPKIESKTSRGKK